MPLREDLLAPIPGDNPGGASLRHDPIYDQIKEARREEDNLAQGVWQHQRKVADFGSVIKLASEAIATRSKDLQLAAWLTEALLRKEGFSGLCEGLDACRGLIEAFWAHLYPEAPSEEDLEIRAAPIEWVGTKLDEPARMTPLVSQGYNWFDYKESRTIGYDEAARSDKENKERQKLIAGGKISADAFEKAFEETPKVFYVNTEKSLDTCLASLAAIDRVCRDKFGNFAPSFSKLQTAVTEIRHTVQTFLEKKRETEPDPIEEEATEQEAEGSMAGENARTAANGPGLGLMIRVGASDPPDKREAIIKIASAAAGLRRKDRANPAPYLMLRGFRWGELRAAVQAGDQTMLEAPSTEVRQHIKTLAVGAKWEELLEAAETAMALPCGRAWLDLQRYVADACVELGPQYHLVARSIRSELKNLLSDLPELLNATLMDDTPAIGAGTRHWLFDSEPPPAASSSAAIPQSAAQDASAPPEGNASDAQPADGETPAPPPPAALPLRRAESKPAAANNRTPKWNQRLADSYELATAALKDGRRQEAFEILFRDIERQPSGRGQFQRKLQLVEMCISSGNQAIAQPILDDLAASIEEHKLDTWEDREFVARALLTIMQASEKVTADAKEKKKLFERICRLDPARALELQP